MVAWNKCTVILINLDTVQLTQWMLSSLHGALCLSFATIWTVVLILQLHTFLRVYCIDNVKIVKIGNFVSYFMFNILKSYVIMDL